LNTGSFVDFLILSEVSKEVDKYRYSTYFHKKKESKGNEIFAGPVWDFNLGYANVNYWSFGLTAEGWLFDEVEDNDWSIMFWWKRLMEDPYFNKLVATRWNSLREKEFSDENISQLIDSLTLLLDEPQQRNYVRWPILGVYIWPNYNWANNAYSDEVSYFENWLYERIAWMDNNVNETVLNSNATLVQVNSQSSLIRFKIALYDDYFNHSSFKTKYFTLNCNDESATVFNAYQISANEGMVEISTSQRDAFVNSDCSITIDSDILNSYNSLTTNSVFVSISDELSNQKPDILVFSAENNINIQTNNTSSWPEKMEVYNTLGQQMAVFELEPTGFNQIYSTLPYGIYVVRIKMENTLITQKVILGN
jgi:hypothetical protein